MPRRPSICACSRGSGYGTKRNNGSESTTPCRAGGTREVQSRTQTTDHPNHSETRTTSHLDDIFLHPPIPALHLSLCTVSVKLHASLSWLRDSDTFHDPVSVPCRHHPHHRLHHWHYHILHCDCPDPDSVNDVHNSNLGRLIKTCLIIPPYRIASRSPRPRYHACIIAVRPASRPASATGGSKRNYSKRNDVELGGQHWAASSNAGIRIGLDYQCDCRTSHFCDFESVRGIFYRDLTFTPSSKISCTSFSYLGLFFCLLLFGLLSLNLLFSVNLEELARS